MPGSFDPGSMAFPVPSPLRLVAALAGLLLAPAALAGAECDAAIYEGKTYAKGSTYTVVKGGEKYVCVACGGCSPARSGGGGGGAVLPVLPLGQQLAVGLAGALLQGILGNLFNPGPSAAQREAERQRLEQELELRRAEEAGRVLRGWVGAGATEKDDRARSSRLAAALALDLTPPGSPDGRPPAERALCAAYFLGRAAEGDPAAARSLDELLRGRVTTEACDPPTELLTALDARDRAALERRLDRITAVWGEAQDGIARHAEIAATLGRGSAALGQAERAALLRESAGIEEELRRAAGAAFE